MTQPTTHEALFIDELRGEARRYRELADQALAQVDDAGFVFTLDAESNSLALIVKHVASNLRSRWTDFYGADGEKPDRQRDREFELQPASQRAMSAALRSLAHTASHVGQIVLLAKHVANDRWRSLSIPRGQSEQVNAMMRERFAAKRAT